MDDDQEIRAVLAEWLQEEGYTVYVAADGKPALERLRTHPAGLVVLLDLMMPVMDGYAVLQAVAAEAPLATKHAYILMTASTRTLPLNMVHLLKHLQVKAVPKPFNIEEVLASVQTATSRLREPSL